MWQSAVEFLAPGFSLVQSWLCGHLESESTDGVSVSQPLLSPTFQVNQSFKKKILNDYDAQNLYKVIVTHEK